MDRTEFETEIRVCSRNECGLRYPLIKSYHGNERCPRCGGTTRRVHRFAQYDEEISLLGRPVSLPIEALLDNIRSAWNVGSIFRTADGLGLRQLYLCGISPTPENPKVAKTSLGAERSVSWSHHLNGVDAAVHQIDQGKVLWGLECTPGALSLDDLDEVITDRPIVLVVGNENAGVDPGILDLCERIVYVPMLGNKHSFNVAVVFGIAVYSIITSVSKLSPRDLAKGYPGSG